jgi:hypothetical protein
MGSLTSHDKKRFLRAKLEEQRHFLRKSLDDMAAGDLVEAIRVAGAIRVLVHETSASTPLLKQLTPNYLQLKILDQHPSRQQEGVAKRGNRLLMSVPVGLRMTSEGIFLARDVNTDARELTVLGRWWTRPSLVLSGVAFSRKEIVLGLANKEGGAHVDPNITRKYGQLLESGFVQIGSSGVTPLNLSRFMAGQAGIELLECLDRNFPAT